MIAVSGAEIAATSTVLKKLFHASREPRAFDAEAGGEVRQRERHVAAADVLHEAADEDDDVAAHGEQDPHRRNAEARVPQPARQLRGNAAVAFAADVTYESLPSQRCCSQNATIVKPSSTEASTRRAGVVLRAAIAKKILVDRTSKFPASTIGLPKSARLSTKPAGTQLASAGAGAARSPCERLSPSMRAASARLFERRTHGRQRAVKIMNAIGEKERSCASVTPGSP
jgi:hypothetical protein